MAKKKEKSNPNIQYLWPIPIITKKFGQYQRVNRALLELFYEHRAKQSAKSAAMYASDDDLLEKYKHHEELQALEKFIRDSVYELASEVNAPFWRRGDQINLFLTGLWFQMTNRHAFHETHVHGNCSWSGVYYVQSGDSTKESEANRQQRLNGITRFYGPHLEHMAGGHNEYGNLYLQGSTWDSYPEDGKLVVFPSYLKHMVFPYNGNDDRVIVSFHARLDNAKGFRFGENYGMN